MLTLWVIIMKYRWNMRWNIVDVLNYQHALASQNFTTVERVPWAASRTNRVLLIMSQKICMQWKYSSLWRAGSLWIPSEVSNCDEISVINNEKHLPCLYSNNKAFISINGSHHERKKKLQNQKDKLRKYWGRGYTYSYNHTSFTLALFDTTGLTQTRKIGSQELQAMFDWHIATTEFSWKWWLHVYKIEAPEETQLRTQNPAIAKVAVGFALSKKGTKNEKREKTWG